MAVEAVQPAAALKGGTSDAVAFWCHEHAGASGLLATVGIFSYEPRVSHRSAIRSSWLSSIPPSFAAHFVLRGRDMQDANIVNHEAAEHRDMLFVNASSLLGRTAGPLMSLVSWFECSLRAFPKVRLVGKCDDDTWMHVSGMEGLLWRALALRKHGAHVGKHSSGLGGSGVRAAAPDRMPELVVGRFERFLWFQNQPNPGHEGPVPAGFAKNPLARGGGACESMADAQNAKPFPFPKGAIFFLSGGAVQKVLDVMRPHALRLIATDATRCFRYSALWRLSKQNTTRPGAVKEYRPECNGLVEVLPPYEDVWTGFALDHLSNTRILAVDILDAFADSYGFRAGQATLAWHSRVDSAFGIRAQLLHNWSAVQFCNGSRHLLECGPAIPACHGAHEWHHCKLVRPHGCDTMLSNLHQLLYSKWAASNHIETATALPQHRTIRPQGIAKKLPRRPGQQIN